jgi:tRNA(Arg) A34 adenosine deaminase TadA
MTNNVTENRDRRFINMAANLAQDIGQFGNARVYALAVYKNEIIGSGFNSSKSHPIALKFARNHNKDCIFPHSEVMALHAASKRLDLNDFKKVTLYVARVKQEKRGGPFIWGLAKPCEGCERAIQAFGVKRVVFTTDNSSMEIHEV